MKHNYHFLFFIVGLLTPLFLPTQSMCTDSSQSLKAFLEEVERNASQVESFACSFTQKRHLSLFPEPVVFRGNLKLIRPDRLRWAFTSPIPSVLIFNGQEGIRCSEDQDPAHFDLKTDPIMRIVAEQILSWLNSDYEKLKKQYSIRLADSSSLHITPREQTTAGFIGSITITFEEKSQQPKRVLINEPNGDSTIIEFFNYHFNISFPPSTFTACQPSE